MNSIFISFMASFCSSFSNLCFSKNSEKSDHPNVNGFLFFLYLVSFISTFLLFPEIWHTKPTIPILVVGGFVGILNTCLMRLTAKALQTGPSGLTFAFQNASAIFPGFLLFIFFGREYGYTYNLLQFLGMIFVLFGLYIGARGDFQKDREISFNWLKKAFLCLVVQVAALTLMQGRCLLFENDPTGFCYDFRVSEKDDVWFMPAQFGLALMLQSYLLLRENRKLNKPEILYGLTAGAANYGSTFLLLLATKFATPFQQCILFPCFAIGTMLLCNIWANKIYQEKFHFLSNVLCAVGIFIAL